jgi:peptide deformylase
MAVLPIYTYGAPVLRKKAKAVDEVSDEIITLVMDMFETMRTANGIGLAATQVGSLHRVLVIDISDLEETKGYPPLTVINPEIVAQEGNWVMEEGCLSIPDVRDDVERAEHVTVRYKDAKFNDVELQAGGILGRVLLHEIDHLNGVLFVDHISSIKRKLHHKALNQIQRGEVEVSYPVVTAPGVTA